MRKCRQSLLLLFVAILSVGPRAHSQSLAEQGGTVIGLIVNVENAEPISGARVGLSRTGRKTVSDGRGGFRFEQVPPGQYVINIEADDFRPVGVLPAIVVTAGQILQDLKLQMRRTATISGRAFDESGQPLPKAKAEVLVFREERDRLWSLAPVFPAQNSPGVESVETNDRGEFRIAGLDPDEYFLRITANREDPKQQKYPPTYYPNTPDPGAAAKVLVTSGTEISGIDVRVAPTAVRVHGRFVLSQEMKPPQDVVLIPRNPRIAVLPPLDFEKLLEQDNGLDTFEITGVAPGSYYLYAVFGIERVESAPIPGVGCVRLPVEIGSENVEDLVVPIHPLASIKGRVIVASDGTNKDDLDFAHLSVSGQFAEMTPACRPPFAGVRADEQFEFRDVSEGKVFIGMSGLLDGWFISAVRLNGENVIASGFSSFAGADGFLEIEVSNAGGTISGAILDKDDHPIPAARYLLVPDLSLRQNWSLIQTGAAYENGEFKVEGLPPGQYTVLAFNDDDQFTPTFLRNPETIEKYERFGQPIHINARQTTRVALTVAPNVP
jgi:hypothetical protein